MSSEDISIVVAIDFGTTFSGFAFANKVKVEEINLSNIRLNNLWPKRRGLPKTNTALLYVNECTKPHKWSEQALTYRPSKKTSEQETYYIVERFKLLLDEDARDSLPVLPDHLDVKNVIADYFVKLKGEIEGILNTRCNRVPLSQVLFVLTVPAEWPPHTRNILRSCVYKAGLLDESNKHKLEFITEPEAASIYCLLSSGVKLSIGDTYLVVDCGGGTVDLTIRTLLPDKTLEEETPRSGDPCGSTFVDQEFEKFLRRVVGLKAMDDFKEKNYGSLQRLIYEFFCPEVKIPFNGDPDEFESVELDLEKVCPALMPYITGEARKKLESEKWIIDIEFEDVMRMFDPVVDKIIDLINAQLESLPEQRKVKTMLLVGGFSESNYLFKRIDNIFRKRIPEILVPPEPIAAIMKGACYYGLNKEIIKIRRLKWSYGIEINDEFKSGDDLDYRSSDGRIIRFDPLANKGDKLYVNEERKKEYKPLKNNQLLVKFKLLYSNLSDPKYRKQYGVKFLGDLTINLPLKSYGTGGQDRIIEFFLKFAEEELKVTARNKKTQETCHTTFKYPDN